MVDVWPSTLPQVLNVQGHQYAFGDLSIRSAPSVGPSKVRPRSSAVSSPLSGQMYLTTTQLGTLRTFYKVTVRGSDVFTFPDPENNASTVNCRFTGSPVVSAMASKTGLWSVTLPMEIIP